MVNGYLLDTNSVIDYLDNKLLVNDLTLITRNVKDFQIIDGLKLINPYYL